MGTKPPEQSPRSQTGGRRVATRKSPSRLLSLVAGTAALFVFCIFLFIIWCLQPHAASTDSGFAVHENTMFDQLNSEGSEDLREKPRTLTMDELKLNLSALEAKNTVSVFGGFTLDSAEEELLDSALEGFGARGYHVGFVMMDLSTGHGVALNADESFYSASSVKAWYVASLVNWEPSVLEYRYDTLYAILSYSSDEDYFDLRSDYGHDPCIIWCEEAGVDITLGSEWFPCCSSRVLAQLWLRNYEFFEEGSEAAEQLTPLYISTYNSAIAENLGGLYTVYSKGGWIGDEDYSSAIDAGIVYAEGSSYLLVIMSDVPGDISMLDPLILALHTIHDEI